MIDVDDDCRVVPIESVTEIRDECFSNDLPDGHEDDAEVMRRYCVAESVVLPD